MGCVPRNFSVSNSILYCLAFYCSWTDFNFYYESFQFCSIKLALILSINWKPAKTGRDKTRFTCLDDFNCLSFRPIVFVAVGLGIARPWIRLKNLPPIHNFYFDVFLLPLLQESFKQAKRIFCFFQIDYPNVRMSSIVYLSFYDLSICWRKGFPRLQSSSLPRFTFWLWPMSIDRTIISLWSKLFVGWTKWKRWWVLSFYICEFNLILGILLLHEATQKVLFNTQCVCNSISHSTCIHKTRGYPISVAVLDKIRGSSYKKWVNFAVKKWIMDCLGMIQLNWLKFLQNCCIGNWNEDK